MSVTGPAWTATALLPGGDLSAWIGPPLRPDLDIQRFIAERHQIMLVADEFGTTVGLVTFEDVIETIFGFEIMDEKDKVPDLQLHARNLWHERARRMGIELPEEEAAALK